MGLLQTWGNFSTYTDSDGRYRVIWQFDDGRIQMQKFDSFKDLHDLELFFADFENWDGAIKLELNIANDEGLIKEMVLYIRNHPTLTLQQWNNALNTKQWYEQAILKVFIYKLALELANKYGVTLDDYTEGQILLKTRNWICSSNLKTLKRAIFGYNLEI